MSEATVIPQGKFYTQREIDNISGLLQALTDTTMSSSEMAFLHVEMDVNYLQAWVSNKHNNKST